MTGVVRQWLLGLQVLAAQYLPLRIYRPAGRMFERTEKYLKARKSRRGKC